jgi:hypothetical protein
MASQGCRRERQLAVQKSIESIERHRWGRLRPSERLRRLGGAASALARLDRGLVGALDAADPDTQRRVTRRVTRRACSEAGLTHVGQVGAALAALDRGDPPPPFDEGGGLRTRTALPGDPGVPRIQVTSIGDPQLLPTGAGARGAARGVQGGSARCGNGDAVGSRDRIRPGAVHRAVRRGEACVPGAVPGAREALTLGLQATFRLQVTGTRTAAGEAPWQRGPGTALPSISRSPIGA